MNKKPDQKKLKLNTETVRQLNNTELKNVAGGFSQFPHVSCVCHQTDGC